MQTDEHRWLERLVGEWTFEADDVVMQPDQPAGKHTGAERARAFGGGWIVCEGHGEQPGGARGMNLMTLGYDPARGRVVGTFVTSMMAHLWVYDGTLDGDRLTLDTEGPSFTTEGRMGRYRDVMRFESDDHRVTTSYYQDDAGEWRTFMTAHYRRTA